MKILVTGSAGFIGFHVSLFLLKRGDDVVGIDNLNDYYDVSLKRARLNVLINFDNSNNGDNRFTFLEADIADKNETENIFHGGQFDAVINLAAQAGVRYSIENPYAYINSNIVGFANILEGCRHNEIEHLVYASSSSVYGANEKLPFSVSDSVDHPLSLYAASKKSNELMAHTYSGLYGLPTTGLRFFTVYGPWGRPDMSLFKFINLSLKGKKIDLYNHGKHTRDFTYIDDVIKIIYLSINKIPKYNKSQKLSENQSKAPWKIYNVSSNRPTKLKKFVNQIESELQKKINFKNLPLQKGDVSITSGDMKRTIKTFGYKPKYKLDYGIKKFVNWYKDYFKLK